MIYRHFGSTAYDPAKFERVVNQPYYVKPEGGLWASPLYLTGMTTAWETRCLTQGFRLKRLESYFDFRLSPSANVYTITRLPDLIQLLRVAAGLGSKDSFQRYLDFEKLATRYDALLLTKEGEERTRHGNVNLYGWECESLLVMNPQVVETLPPVLV